VGLLVNIFVLRHNSSRDGDIRDRYRSIPSIVENKGRFVGLSPLRSKKLCQYLRG
jgi:hypothetical protein